jgi:hypothetical protein
MQRSKFQAPTFLDSFPRVAQAFSKVQEALDAATRSGLVFGVQTRAMTLTPGTTIRVSPPSGNLAAVLPPASPENAGESVVVLLENPSGYLVVYPSARQTLNGASSAAFTEAGLLVLTSNGIDGWFLPNGETARGRVLRATQYLTSGTSITHPTGTRIIRVRGVGGGGAGGGCASGAGAMGGMGGSGTYGEKWYTLATLTSAYVVGAAGAANSAAAGDAGGDSTFTHDGVVLTLPGGNGGATVAAGSTVSDANGGSNAGVATNADFEINGQRGAHTTRLSASEVFNIGPGGSNPLGSGAGSVSSSGAVQGFAATGYGAGGGGSYNAAVLVDRPGGAGTPGIWLVEEYS